MQLLRAAGLGDNHEDDVFHALLPYVQRYNLPVDDFATNGSLLDDIINRTEQLLVSAVSETRRDSLEPIAFDPSLSLNVSA